MSPDFIYRARVTRIIDGDTLDAHVDLGFDVWVQTRFRLHGIDTPEKNSKDPIIKARAMEAAEFCRAHVLDQEVVIRCLGRDKYGRWLGVIHKPDQASLNEQLLALGLARAYFGDNKTLVGW